MLGVRHLSRLDNRVMPLSIDQAAGYLQNAADSTVVPVYRTAVLLKTSRNEQERPPARSACELDSHISESYWRLPFS